MFAIEKLTDVSDRLSAVYKQRLQKGKLLEGRQILRGPVGLFLVREDGASGSKLAKEVVGSFGYWDARTEHFFDGVFLGWGYDGRPGFIEGAFVRCVKDLEQILDWKYQGGAHLLLTNFVYDVGSEKGDLDFSQTIPLDISDLLNEKKLKQLSPLIEELTAPLRELSAAGDSDVWVLSDYISFLRTRDLLWKYLVKKIGLLLGWVDEVAPYTVRDVRKAK
jgi:hypothetical protein